MVKPRVLVFSGYGLNCEEETKYAFNHAGALANIVHVNDLIDGLTSLKNYQILALPGGFSYGDDTGSGKAYANKLKNHLEEELQKFIERDTLTIGICNGFQILTNLGLLPGALLHNKTARYINRWVDIKVTNKTPWFNRIKRIAIPIAHGEGRFYADSKTRDRLKKDRLIAAKYTKGEVFKYQNLEYNPNGALDDIAAVAGFEGRVLGMMPHPERAIRFTQFPNWTYLREKLKRAGKKIPENGPGLAIFKNAVNYFK
ncbi:MAG: phosphoribosylformylglycinamidine synthase I [Candidatus Blackburnbacteria bacterium]|nr:phosphoribosylformylglycinamidine synthase I [Candidatus Blackburnbacteria bacterium]